MKRNYQRMRTHRPLKLEDRGEEHQHFSRMCFLATQAVEKRGVDSCPCSNAVGALRYLLCKSSPRSGTKARQYILTCSWIRSNRTTTIDQVSCGRVSGIGERDRHLDFIVLFLCGS